MKNSVEVSDLRVDRGGRRVLHGASFALEPATVTGLLGPSGCGKTTLMRSIAGVQRTAGGGVTVLGKRAGSAALRARVAYMTQAPSLYGDLTVRENLRYFARILGAEVADADRVVAPVRLGAAENQVVTSLSGGQRARASLATALLGSPEVLVLDEPTVGLDPVLRRDLWRMLRELAGSGATLLVSSHVMDEAAHCDRLLLLREGRLIADETPAALSERTGTDDLEQAFRRVIEGQEVAA